MAAIVVQSNKPGYHAVLHRLCHVLTYADHVLVAHDVAHTIAHGVAHGNAHDVAFDIALAIACSFRHKVLIANGFWVL